MQVLRLFPAVQQFQVKNGALNTDGRLYVYLNGTDDLAECFDADGSRIAQPVILDNNGRAPGLFVDSSKVYRLVVQDRYGSLLFTVRNMVPTGGGAGSSLGKTYEVVSNDGSISVDKSVDAGVTTYDIGLAPSSDEFLEWIKCSEEDCGATWYPVFQDGSMETEAGQGIKVHKGHLYHFTNSFTVDPDGTGVNYDTFRVIMYCGDEEVDMREFDIDSSLNDQVLCEFSRDVVPSEDTHVYFKLTIPSTCEVSGEVQCHRIYSGINAVPDTCATKQWVQETFDYNLSSKVDYSAIEYNGYGQISGISGSAIAGGVDSATVSSIASSVASAYTESAFSSLSSKADSSALSAYQPVSAMGAYATTAYVDGRVSGKLDTTAFNSGDFYPTANPSGFITGVDLSDYATTGFVESAVSGKLDTTAFNPGDFYTTANESGFVGRAYVDSSVSGKLDTSAFASASAGFQPTGDYAFNSSLSSYIPTSASGAFQPSGDYAFNSAVSSKLDASASGNFVMNAAMTSWIPYSALGYSGTAISGIGGSSLAGMGGGADYTGVYPVNVDNDTREISLDSLPLVTDSSMTAYGSAGSSVIGVNMDILSGKQDTLAFAYNAENQISSINGSALGGMDEVAVSGIASAYAQSAASGKLDSSAFNSGDFYTTANESGFLTGVPPFITATRLDVDSAIVNRALDVTGHVRAYNNSSDNNMYGNFDYAGMYFRSGSQRPYNIGIDNTGSNFYIATAKNRFERIYASSIQSWNGKLDSTAFNSGDFYSTANPSGFITGVDLSPYQTTADMSSYIPTSMSSDFQQVTGMSSYVPYSSIGYNTASAISGINGSALAGTTYSAGTGIDITDDVISVEAPVDIVAGPGIVIDNPDGNTLRVSTEADAETVLWTGTIGAPGSTGVLSEDVTNFEFVEVYAEPVYGGMCPVVTRFATISSGNAVRFGTFSQDSGNSYLANYTVDFSGTSVSVARAKRISINHSNGSVSVTDIVTTGSFKAPITKIVGIHRIANN